eukprot:6077434-Amphidinium_carterae.1
MKTINASSSKLVQNERSVIPKTETANVKLKSSTSFGHEGGKNTMRHLVRFLSKLFETPQPRTTL